MADDRGGVGVTATAWQIVLGVFIAYSTLPGPDLHKHILLGVCVCVCQKVRPSSPAPAHSSIYQLLLRWQQLSTLVTSLQQTQAVMGMPYPWVRES